ncbi:hypothetical protein H8K21_15885 [Undibacterium oligocarboniphilum]|nr:hypothetical protein [Undibacterium oligocarboniphilum]
MIGLIESDEQVNEIITGIKRGIQEDATIQLLRMLTNKNGKTIISPSPIFPACEFDSRHARDHVPNTNDVLIGYIFLSHRK